MPSSVPRKDFCVRTRRCPPAPPAVPRCLFLHDLLLSCHPDLPFGGGGRRGAARVARRTAGSAIGRGGDSRRRRKWNARWLPLAKPTSCAMKESGQRVVARRRRARSTRRPMIYWCGAAPVATLNRRAKWYGLRCATWATASSARSSARWSSMYAVTRRRSNGAKTGWPPQCRSPS